MQATDRRLSVVSSTPGARRRLIRSVRRISRALPMNSQSILFRRAIACSLAISVPLLIGVCVLVAGVHDGTRLAFAYPIQAAVAFGCMFAFGWLAAPRWGPTCARYSFLAGLFAISVFLIGVLSGSVTSMFVYRDFSLFDYIIKPLYWLGMFGFIPAFIVGVVGSFIARRLLRIHENA